MTSSVLLSLAEIEKVESLCWLENAKNNTLDALIRTARAAHEYKEELDRLSYEAFRLRALLDRAGIDYSKDSDIPF